MKKNPKILVIRFSSIGDIVLTTPVLRCIKQQVPGAELHYLTRKEFEIVLKANPYIDKLHYLYNDINETIRSLKYEYFDYVIDLHHNLRTLRIKMALGKKSWSFKKLNIEKWLLVNFKINTLPTRHIVERYLDTAASLGVKNDGKGLEYYLTEDYQLTDLLPSTHQKYVGLVIGAQHFTKRMPVEKLIDICKKLDQPVVILGGKTDTDTGNQLVQACGEKVFNACGKFNLDQSAFLVQQASHIISNDTGLMHIAAAFNRPVTAVWGNTVPEFGMYPYRVEHVNAEVQGLSCRPCSKIGYNHCPKGHFKCMYEQSVESIVNSVHG